MQINLLEVDILVNGKPIRQYAKNGKIFIEARAGTEYSIRLRNNNWYRKLAIVSVDGINVIDGKAGGSTNQGYVINGYASYEVQGFRTSNDNVNVFKFNNKSKSYAAKSEETGGDTSNCGVIGVKFYDEKVTFVSNNTIYSNPIFTFTPPILTSNMGGTTVYDWDSSVSNDISYDREITRSPPKEINERRISSNQSVSNLSAGGQSSMLCCNFVSTPVQETFQAGTEFSDKEVTDKVTEVAFEIGNLAASFEIYYAFKQALIDLGVPIYPVSQIKKFPEAFPSKFCKSPRR